MSQELIGIIIATIALAGLILSGQRATNARMDKIEARMDKIEARMDRIESRLAQLEQRMARLEGLLDGLREAMFNRAPPPVPAV